MDGQGGNWRLSRLQGAASSMKQHNIVRKAEYAECTVRAVASHRIYRRCLGSIDRIDYPADRLAPEISSVIPATEVLTTAMF